MLSVRMNTWEIIIAANENIFWSSRRMVQHRKAFSSVRLIYCHLSIKDKKLLIEAKRFDSYVLKLRAKTKRTIVPSLEIRRTSLTLSCPFWHFNNSMHTSPVSSMLT